MNVRRSCLVSLFFLVPPYSSSEQRAVQASLDPVLLDSINSRKEPLMSFPTHFLRGGAGFPQAELLFGNASGGGSLSSPCIHLLTFFCRFLAGLATSVEWGETKGKHETAPLCQRQLVSYVSSFILSPPVFKSAASFHPTSLFVFTIPNIRQEAVKLLPRNKLCPEFLSPWCLATCLVSPQISTCFRRSLFVTHSLPTRPTCTVPWLSQDLPQYLLGWLVSSFRNCSVFNDYCCLWKIFASTLLPPLILIVGLHTST